MEVDRTNRFRFIAMLLTWGLLMVVFWAFMYGNHLLNREQMQLFMFGSDYFFGHLAKPGGLAVYLAEFVVQFFVTKLSGGLLLAVLLMLLAWMARRVLFFFSTHPLINLFAFFPALGFAILFLDPMFHLGGFLSLLLCLCLLQLVGISPRRRVSYLFGVLLLPIVYWLTGGAYLIFGFVLIVAHMVNRNRLATRKKGTFLTLFGEVVVVLLPMVAMPLIIRQVYLFDTVLNSYLSDVFFAVRGILPSELVMVLLILPFLVFLVVFIPDKSRVTKGHLRAGLGSLLVITLAAMLFVANFKRESEFRFDQRVYQQQWNKIIDNYKPDKHQSAHQQLAVILALGQNGRLVDEAFASKLNIENMFLHTSFRGFSPLIASEPYFYLGLNNFAQMMAMESVETAPDARLPARAVKRLAQTYIVNGHYQVAKKYLLLLQKTWYYRTWAKQNLNLLGDESAIDQHVLYGHLRKLMLVDDFYLNTDYPEMSLLLLLKANQGNRLAYEFLMVTYLHRLDFDSFLKYLPLFNGFGYETVPLSFQQALAYVETMVEEWPDGINPDWISAEVREQLAAYAQIYLGSQSNKQAELENKFGHTYWYFVHYLAEDEFVKK